MSKIEKVLFTGMTHTAGSAREGAARGGHGRLDIRTSASGSGTKQEQSFEAVLPHPTAEQLFAGAWSACYITALSVAAQELKMQVPPDLALEVEIDLGQTGAAYFIEARFNVIAPGMTSEDAEALAHRAHQICPYSKATHGNIDVSARVSTSRASESVSPAAA